MKVQKIMLINIFVFMNIFVNAEVVKVFDFDQLPQKSTEHWIYEVATVNKLPKELLSWYEVPTSKWIVDKDGRSHRVTEMETRSYIPYKYSKDSNLTGVVYIGQEDHWFYEGVTLKRISRNYTTTKNEENCAIFYATITYTVETWTTRNAPMKQYLQTGLTVGATGLVLGCSLLALGGCLHVAGMF
ncbi:MAG: hypothetical protein K2X69_02205 [Silvanigrellaceae bacterium]|nr:hypothetical protein [Silvanigrellaceae bacterium]